jgi:hypothetical protein
MGSKTEVVPNCGIPEVRNEKPAAGGLANKVKVERFGFAKSTWKWKTLNVPPAGNSTKDAGAPPGGKFEPSRSAGRYVSSAEPPVIPVVMNVAG